MKTETKKGHMDSVYVLLLFAVFAGCILLVLLFGASTYEKLVERDNHSFEKRTGISYIAAKIRHNDRAGCVSLGSFSDRSNGKADEIDTLYMQFIGEDNTPVEGYYTKIYYYDGFIREILCEDGIALKPEDGNEIMEASGLDFSNEGGILTISVVYKDGSRNSLSLRLRSEGADNMGESL